MGHHLVPHLIVILPLSQTTNHLQSVFHPIATPTPKTISKRTNNRIMIIPESALKWVVRPISSLVDLHPNAFFLPVILPITMSTSTIPTHEKIPWMNHLQFAFHLIVIPPTSPAMNTNLSQ